MLRARREAMDPQTHLEAYHPCKAASGYQERKFFEIRPPRHTLFSPQVRQYGLALGRA